MSNNEFYFNDKFISVVNETHNYTKYSVSLKFSKIYSPETKLEEIRQGLLKSIEKYFFFLDTSNKKITKENEESIEIQDIIQNNITIFQYDKEMNTSNTLLKNITISNNILYNLSIK